MTDTLQHKGRRKILQEQISKRYNFDKLLMAAMGKVPRHLFLDAGLDHLAYLDRPLPIGAKQTISQPYTVAMQTQLLGLGRFDKVLEIGTGCGYQTAILAEMGMRVFSVERQRSLFLQAQKNLERLGYHSPLLFYGDGFEGVPKFAPFKGILITCGAPDIPHKLLKQLALGGKMVVPIGLDVQKMIVIERKGEDEYICTEHGDYKFVPMLEGVEK